MLLTAAWEWQTDKHQHINTLSHHYASFVWVYFKPNKPQQQSCCTLTQVSPLDQFHYTVQHYAGTLIVVLELLTEHNFPLKESQRNEQRERICTEDL